MVTEGERDEAKVALSQASEELYDNDEVIAEAAGVSVDRVHEQAEEIDMLKRAVEQREEDPDPAEL